MNASFLSHLQQVEEHQVPSRKLPMRKRLDDTSDLILFDPGSDLFVSILGAQLIDKGRLIYLCGFLKAYSRLQSYL